MTLTLLRQGGSIPVPPVEKALRFLGASGRRAAAAAAPSSATAATVRARARGGRRASTAPRRSIVVTITHDHAARRRSYELIAEAFGLAGGPRAA